MKYKAPIRALFEVPRPESGVEFLKEVKNIFQSATQLRLKHDWSIVATPSTLPSIPAALLAIINLVVKWPIKRGIDDAPLVTSRRELLKFIRNGLAAGAATTVAVQQTIQIDAGWQTLDTLFSYDAGDFEYRRLSEDFTLN